MTTTTYYSDNDLYPDRSLPLSARLDPVERRAYVTGINPQAFALHDRLLIDAPALAEPLARKVTELLAWYYTDEQVALDRLALVRDMLLDLGHEEAAALVPEYLDDSAFTATPTGARRPEEWS